MTSLTASIEISVASCTVKTLRLAVVQEGATAATTSRVGDRALRVFIFVLVAELHLDVEGLGGQVLSACRPYVLRQALRVYIVQFLVMNEHFWGQPLQDPLVSDSFIGSHSLLRVPLKAALDKVDKRLVAAL